MTSDGHELKCRIGSGIQKPLDTNPHASKVLVVSGRVEADGSISVESPFIELGAEVDMNLLDEAINLQFRKEFAHLFYSPIPSVTYA